MSKILRFPKVKPEKSDIQICKALMSRLDDLAPDGSNNQAEINLLEDGRYHTVIAVNADCGQFKSEGLTFTLISSLKKAHKDMLDLLRDWKAVRFL